MSRKSSFGSDNALDCSEDGSSAVYSVSSLADPHTKDASAFERFSFHASWVAGTVGGCLAGVRQPHNEIYKNPVTGVSLTLGSLLLDNVRSSKLTEQLRQLTLQYFAEKHPGRELFVIQVLKDFELDTPLFGTGLKAIALNREDVKDGISVQVRRLMLADFSSDMTPTEDFLGKFYRIYRELGDKENTDIYVHCKAGVNRSFRVSAALHTLFKLDEIKEGISFASIVDKVAETCVAIRATRPYIDLHPANCIKQVSFITHLVLKGRNMSNEVDDSIMEKRVLQSIRTVLLPEFFKAYIKNRENDRKSTSLLAGLFKSPACGKTSKLVAAQKFLDDLQGKEQVMYSTGELDALDDGRLKDLVRWTRKTVGLPVHYTQALESVRAKKAIA